MTIANHEGRSQICCDTCPAGLPLRDPETFPAMVERAKAVGWQVQKVQPKPDKSTSDLFGAKPRIAGKADQPFTHTCPSCAKPQNDRRLF